MLSYIQMGWRQFVNNLSTVQFVNNMSTVTIIEDALRAEYRRPNFVEGVLSRLEAFGGRILRSNRQAYFQDNSDISDNVGISDFVARFNFL